jgi:hypothetical protein
MPRGLSLSAHFPRARCGAPIYLSLGLNEASVSNALRSPGGQHKYVSKLPVGFWEFASTV